MDEYAAGRTPNPCLRCNEKIKFAAVLDRALALGLRRRRHRPLRAAATGADGLIEMHRAVDHGKDQSYVLGVLDPGAARHSLFPLGDTDQARRARARPSARGLLVADKPDSPRHLLRRRRRQRGLAAREARRPGAQPRRRHRRRRHRRGASAATTGTYGFTIGQRKRPAARPPGARRQAALRARHRAGHRHRHGRAPRARSPSTASPAIRPRWCGTVPVAARGHRAAARPRRRAPRGRHAWTAEPRRRSSCSTPPRASRPARPRSSTTAPASSARPRSPPPTASAPDRTCRWPRRWRGVGRGSYRSRWCRDRRSAETSRVPSWSTRYW